MSDDVQVGDVFEPADGASGQAVEVTHASAVTDMADCRKLDSGITFSVPKHMLLDPLRWKPAGHMGSRVVPSLGTVTSTVGMERKATKWRPSLVPSGTMESIARAMQAGIDAGHVEGDWKQREARVFVEAAIRHLLAELGGERVDQSGLLALDHALASVAIARNLVAERGP